ncbi:TPA: hypothetical protein DEA21_00165 [Candidatus Uhrbacteria bacterium]|nr:hypothetical protein [Candidatus Uhrbacteria bacterium]
MSHESGTNFDPSGAEAEAAEQIARENIEVAPQSAEQLFEATEAAVDSLLSRLVRNPSAVEYLTEISVRVQRYLLDDKTGQPSLFAKGLVQKINNPALIEVGRQLVSEINPLFFGLRKAVTEHNAMTQAGVSADLILEKEGGLVDLLKIGKVAGQKTTTVFGYLEGLSSEQESTPTKIVVIDPFGENEANKKYWQERRAAREEMFERTETYQEIIANRSAAAVFELDAVSRVAEVDGDAELVEAAITLADFIDSQIDPLKNDFKKTVGRLSFFRGQADQMIDLLNAAEVLKQKNPQLFARLLGVSQGRESSEAERSDLFGNIFHIAFHRSLRRSPRGVSALPGRQVLREQLDGLLELETKQLPLQHVNPEQMEQMQSQLKAELEKSLPGAKEKPNPILVAMLTGTLVERVREVELHELFRAVSKEAEEKLEGPEARIEELRQLYEKIKKLGPLPDHEELEAEFALGLISKRKSERIIIRRVKALPEARTDRAYELSWLVDFAIKSKLDLNEVFGDFLKIVEAEMGIEKYGVGVVEKKENLSSAIILKAKIGLDFSKELKEFEKIIRNNSKDLIILLKAQRAAGIDTGETVGRIFSYFETGNNFSWLDIVDVVFGLNKRDAVNFLHLFAAKFRLRSIPMMNSRSSDLIDFAVLAFDAGWLGWETGITNSNEELVVKTKIGMEQARLAGVEKSEIEELRKQAVDELVDRFQKEDSDKRKSQILVLVVYLGGIAEAVRLCERGDLVWDRGWLASEIAKQASAAKQEIADVRWEKECTREARELFGKNFFGVEQIESAFTIKDRQDKDVKLIDLSPSERQQAEQMLKEKLNEPDIKEFFSRPKNQRDIKDGKYLLILRVNTIKVNSQDVPLTIKAMKDLIAPDMEEKGQGKLLWNTRIEDFYTTSTPVVAPSELRRAQPTFEWIIVTKDVVQSTLGKDHLTQTTKLQEEAERIGLDSTKIKRRQPVQTVFDHLVSLRTINQRLLENRYDRSDESSSPGFLAYVGSGGSLGLRLLDGAPDNSRGRLGASLSR